MRGKGRSTGKGRVLGKIIRTIYIAAALFFVVVGIGGLLYSVGNGWLALGFGSAMIIAWCLGEWGRRRLPWVYLVFSRLIATMFVAALVLCLIVSAQIMSCYFDDKAPGDAVMVLLGCGLSQADGLTPSLVLYGRLFAAEAYLKANPNTVCILSGGQGPDENRTEASAMFEYLGARGIAEERLYLEEASTSTKENIQFSKELMAEKGLVSGNGNQSLLVVTDGFHQFRAQSIAKDYGFDCYTVRAKTPLGLIPLYWLREIPGIILQVWRG